ncbi:MAG: ABC transporter ATP-binding protein [Sphaerochaeta sp.]|jgi:ABC-2 type transport system ATP-binding protein|nr:ABC transporter ATP-binding protein [Sphaerochaeta sp.]MDX9915958.1 ABC transporter ATP-binding protein [Sphaerochaeta sp.]
MDHYRVAEVDGLSFSYKHTPLFKDLSFSLERGNIYGLLGKNGAGKSTLLKLLGGQLFAQGGTLSVMGENPQRRTPSLLGEIFYLSEEFPLPRMKSQQYLAMLTPFYGRFDHERFAQYAAEFDLDLLQRLDQMSLGQKKKYLLAFGLASNCRLLIMDEPTNGLDIPSKRQFRQIVASAMSEERTFVISTHQVRDMEALIDPIIILDQGRVIFNEGLDTLTDAYVMDLVSVDPGDDVLYKEKVLGGWMVLRSRAQGQSGQSLDLETIFNILVEKGGRL